MRDKQAQRHSSQISLLPHENTLWPSTSELHPPPTPGKSEQSPSFPVSSSCSVRCFNACLAFAKRLLRFHIFGTVYTTSHITPVTSRWPCPLRDASLQAENERGERAGQTQTRRRWALRHYKSVLEPLLQFNRFSLFLKKKVSFSFNRSSPGPQSHFFSQGSRQQPLETRAIRRPDGAGERLWPESPPVSYGRSLPRSFSGCHSFLLPQSLLHSTLPHPPRPLHPH